MTFAAHDLKFVQLPVGWDQTYLKNYAMADGITLDRVVTEMETALRLFNGEAAWYDKFTTVTDELTVEYEQGDLVTEAHSEYTPPKGQRTDYTGHMLPVLERDLGFRFTKDFFVKGSFRRVQGSIRAGIDAFRQFREYLILRRALRRADDTGISNGLGSTGISPGFATAAANTGVDFQPSRYGGVAFTTDHEHYLGYAAANLATALSAAINHLREHGHTPPFELWIPSASVATVMALTGAVAITPTTQVPGSNTAQTIAPPDTVNDAAYYVGSYGDGKGGDAWVRVVPRMPTNYYWMGKPYGFGDPRNPFMVRWDPRWGPEGVLHIADNVNYPLADSYMFEARGIGVGDRTNGVAIFIDAGAAWVEATVSQ